MFGVLGVVLAAPAHADDKPYDPAGLKAQVAALESSYLHVVEAVNGTDYVALGYKKPVHVAYVPSAAATALR